jgi:hypothetical protein
MNHRTTNRRGTQNPAQTASRPQGAGFSKTKMETRSERTQPFVEDFNMEHCCSAVTVALIAFSANSDSAESRNPYTQSMNLPSCVYLG